MPRRVIQMNAVKHPATKADVNLAVEMTYKFVVDNESADVELSEVES